MRGLSAIFDWNSKTLTRKVPGNWVVIADTTHDRQLFASLCLSCRVAKVQRVQTEIEKADVEKHEALLTTFQATLGDTEESYHHTLSELLATIKDRKLQDDARLQVEVKIVASPIALAFSHNFTLKGQLLSTSSHPQWMAGWMMVGLVSLGKLFSSTPGFCLPKYASHQKRRLKMVMRVVMPWLFVLMSSKLIFVGIFWEND